MAVMGSIMLTSIMIGSIMRWLKHIDYVLSPVSIHYDSNDCCMDIVTLITMITYE